MAVTASARSRQDTTAAFAAKGLRGWRAGGLLLSLLLFSVLARPVRAEVPEEWLGVRIVEVRVVGEEAGRVDVSELGVRLGERLSRGMVRGAISGLIEQGRWADIQVDAAPAPGGGLVLLFHLTPRLIAHRIDVVGNREFDDREVLRLLSAHEGGEIEREQFAGWTEALREKYAEAGYHAARVRLVLRDMDDPAHKVVRVEIQEGEPTRISSIVFAGDTLPQRRGMRRILGFRAGDVANMARIQAGLHRAERELRRQGYYRASFGEPRLEEKGRRVRVLIPSRVGPRYEIRFQGGAPLSDSELFAALDFSEERVKGEASLRALEQELSQLYRRYGFPSAKVRMKERLETRIVRSKVLSREWEEQVLVLEVAIKTGEQLEIDAITFPGATHFTANFLREQIYSYSEEDMEGAPFRDPVDPYLADQVGFGGARPRRLRVTDRPMRMDPRHLFYASSYEQALSHLRELYQGDGFLDVKVSDVELRPLQQPNHAVAVVSIDEGPRTFLYDVGVANNQAIASRALLAAAGLKRNSPFSYLKLEEARLRLVEAYQERGFFFARVDPTVTISDDGTRASVLFHVEEGYLVHVGSIEIRGHVRSSETMILNRVRLTSGDLFRPSLARETEDALLALDVFTSVTVAPEQQDLPARVKNVVISLTERKTQWLGWSAGFSTGEGMRGGLEYGYRNLFGSALQASFRGQLGYQFVFLDQEIERQYKSLSTDKRIEYQTTLTLAIPYIRSLPKNTASIDLAVLSDIQRDFRIEKQGVVVSLFYRPIRRLTFSVAEELESSNFTLLAEVLRSSVVQPSFLVPDGQNTLLSTQFSMAIDLRDRAYNPRKGVLISISPEYDRTLSTRAGEETAQRLGTDAFNSNMLRLIGSFAFYIPVLPKLTFASQWRYGRIVHLTKSSRSYPNRLFYLGGSNFRGFNVNQVVPQDVQDSADFDPESLVSHGGQTFVAGQNELRFPLYGDLYGGLFADIGNLWFKPAELSLRELMVVYGAGLRLQTPVASLAFDYGVREIRDRFELVGAFQFAFQTF